ncbi:MAG: hypothetical protein JSV88_00760 [Candidatus Aminicenantes bacterium]|nr:MAG: hypothetical protein JSV88_00760 [Candidatus Aminicenantes bacterium]
MKNSMSDRQQLRPGGAALKRIMTSRKQEMVTSMLLMEILYQRGDIQEGHPIGG